MGETTEEPGEQTGATTRRRNWRSPRRAVSIAGESCERPLTSDADHAWQAHDSPAMSRFLRRCDLLRRRVVAPIIALLVSLLSGCASDQPPAAPAPSNTFASASPSNDQDADRAATSLRLLADELNSARLASRKVETMPAVANALARREILLHVTLYRAAYQTRVSRLDHIVLEPVSESDPPDIGIDPEEFRLRILGALDDLPSPVAWITETWRKAAIDYFPNTNERATRLRITILQRRDDEGVVVGEISDWTANLGASKQKVTCTWDGLAWNLERDPVRVEW